MAKTHYAEAQREPESNYMDWGDTLCGLNQGESPVTDRAQYVSCKRCLKAMPRHIEAMKNIHNA